MSESREIVVTVSQPYVAIAGGWTGMRPVGRRRTYRAVVDGKEYQDTSRATLCTNIKHKLYPVRPRFTFQDESGR